MVEFRFNFVDIFRAPRLALSAKKIWTQFRSLAAALVLYNLGVYLALVVSGADVYRIWSSYYLFPTWALVGGEVALNAAGWVFLVLGVLAAAVAVYVGMTAVAKITVEQLRGNDFFSRREAGRFVRRHWRPVVWAPVMLGLVLALLLGAGLLVGVVGKIPWAGEVLASLGIVPLFLGALLFVFLGLVFVLSFWLTPAIVATTGDDTFETSFELFSTLSGQPWRLALYELLSGALTLTCGALFAGFSFAALRVVYWVLYLPMGAKWAAVFGAAWRVMPAHFRGAAGGGCALCDWWTSWTAGGGWCGGAVLPLPWPQAIAATFVSLALLVILGIVYAYGLNVHTAAQTIIYTVLRKKKDDENLLEMYDDELEQAMLGLSGEAVNAAPAREIKPAGEESTPPPPAADNG